MATTEELLNVRREQLSPGTIRILLKDGVNDKGQQPLTAVHPHLFGQGRGQSCEAKRSHSIFLTR